MLPQERFAFKYLYEGHFLRKLPVSSAKDIESIMAECNLKYREGKSAKDLREAFWGYGSMFKRGFDSHAEWALERADKVFTIDWSKVQRI